MVSWVSDLLMWFFSNSGAIGRGKKYVKAQTDLMFVMGKHPLTREKCKFCKVLYWAFTKNNYYCGRFSCYRRAKHAGK